MIRPTDSTHPNSPIDTPPQVQRIDPLAGVNKIQWPRKPLGKAAPKSGTAKGFARTGIQFGIRKKRG